MNCDVGEATEVLENDLWFRWSNGRVGEWAVTYVKWRKDWRMSFDVGKATEGLVNVLWRRWSYEKVGEWAELYTVLYTVEQSSFSNPSVASPTSQLILQPLFRFPYAIGSSLTSPGEPPMCLIKFIILCVLFYYLFYFIIFESFDCDLTQEFFDSWI